MVVDKDELFNRLKQYFPRCEESLVSLNSVCDLQMSVHCLIIFTEIGGMVMIKLWVKKSWNGWLKQLDWVAFHTRKSNYIGGLVLFS